MWTCAVTQPRDASSVNPAFLSPCDPPETYRHPQLRIQGAAPRAPSPEKKFLEDIAARDNFQNAAILTFTKLSGSLHPHPRNQVPGPPAPWTPRIRILNHPTTPGPWTPPPEGLWRRPRRCAGACALNGVPMISTGSLSARTGPRGPAWFPGKRFNQFGFQRKKRQARQAEEFSFFEGGGRVDVRVNPTPIALAKTVLQLPWQP